MVSVERNGEKWCGQADKHTDRERDGMKTRQADNQKDRQKERNFCGRNFCKRWPTGGGGCWVAFFFCLKRRKKLKWVPKYFACELANTIINMTTNA